MPLEVMEHYGLTQSITQAGYYETAHHKQLIKDIKGAIREGRLIAVCGMVGSGKTGACSSNLRKLICSYCEPGWMDCEPGVFFICS